MAAVLTNVGNVLLLVDVSVLKFPYRALLISCCLQLCSLCWPHDISL